MDMRKGESIAGLCGVIAPPVVFTLILYSISRSPWFRWNGNALSDLGVHEVSLLFNSSLILGGMLILIFSIGLAMALRSSTLGLVGSLLLLFGSIALIGIGFFPESHGAIHYLFSVTFFTTTPLSILVIGVSMIRKKVHPLLRWYSVLSSISAICVWVLPHGGAAIPETVSSLMASAWAVLMGVNLFLERL